MINPLSISSDGYLNCGSPLTIVTRGLLDNCGYTPTIPDPEEDRKVSGSGSKKKALERKKELMSFYKKEEDKEIMVIIKAFIECQ